METGIPMLRPLQFNYYTPGGLHRMTTLYGGITRRKTNVLLFATHSLTRQSLQAVLNADRELNVSDTAETSTELLEKISKNSPDVILFCLMKDEEDTIKILEDIRCVSPQIKSVILSCPDSTLDYPAALNLGVTGVVGADQGARALIRAIRQVSEGEVWLNQKLLAQLLNNNFNPVGTKPITGSCFKSDELTKRELEVVGMIGLGMNNKNISKTMYISEATVRHHLSSIYSKLNVEDRLNLAIYAHRRQIVRPQLSRTA